MERYYVLYFIGLYLSLYGLFYKAGIKAWYGLIPFYNLYHFLKLLEINPIIIILLGLALVFLPFKMFYITLIVIFLPFIICFYYNVKYLYAIICILCPVIIFPLIAYRKGIYGE